jgi:hypothetical protein
MMRPYPLLVVVELPAEAVVETSRLLPLLLLFVLL